MFTKIKPRHGIVVGGLLSCLVVAILGCTDAYEFVEVDGDRRQYLLHVPEHLPADSPVPLVLALHQFLDTPKRMREMTALDSLADREGFIVVYPRGRWRRWESTNDKTGPDHRFLNAILDSLQHRYPIDPERIYATGASAGAMMIQAFALHSNRLRAIAPVMGTLPTGLVNPEQSPTPLSVLVIHGVKDPVIPYAGGTAGGPHATMFLSAEETTAYWAGVAGCEVPPSIEMAENATWHVYSCDGLYDVRLLAVNGCGHSWPGHKSRFPQWIVGPSVSIPQATRILWDFFSAQGASQ